MGTKHKHYDVIVAWANGEKCEFFSPITEKWEPLNPNSVPAFYEDYQYRIKPKRVKKEGWANVFPAFIYSSKESADGGFDADKRIACIRVEWEQEV